MLSKLVKQAQHAVVLGINMSETAYQPEAIGLTETDTATGNDAEKSYRELHRPASEFSSREAYLDHELKIMKPRRWALNLPGRDFNFEWEDLVPAIAGTIGKIGRAHV